MGSTANRRYLGRQRAWARSGSISTAMWPARSCGGSGVRAAAAPQAEAGARAAGRAAEAAAAWLGRSQGGGIEAQGAGTVTLTAD
jgi:hypothetical protein